jgi:dTDP-4-amino-4,6-dideoxygalactose transaminase
MSNPTPIPMLELSSEIEALWDELNTAIHRVLKSGQFVLGAEVEAFEGEVANYLGVKHAIGVNSGTDALVIGLRALGIGDGDEVITTPFSFFATAESISTVGARPVFVDVDEASFNLDPALVEAAITPKTKAIMPVHLYGRPCEMDAIMAIAEKHGLKVIEDCAQSFGARYQGKQTGTIGDVGAFSFYPTKNLGAYGDGGLLVTDSDELALLSRKLRNHGSLDRYHNEMLGYNSRLDALQAAILRVKLPHVERWNAQRREAAERYNACLADLRGVVTPEIVEGHVFHQYTVRVLEGRREAVHQALRVRAIASVAYYPTPLNRMPPYTAMSAHLPISEHLAHEVLSLPLWPGIPSATQRHVTDGLRRYLML